MTTPVRRQWTDRELATLFGEHDDPVVRELYQFVRQESCSGQIQSVQPKAQPTLNFYVDVVTRADGKEGPFVAMEYRYGEGRVRLYLNWKRYRVSESALAAYTAGLREAFEGRVSVAVPEPSVPLPVFGQHFAAFKGVFLGFRDAIEKGDR